MTNWETGEPIHYCDCSCWVCQMHYDREWSESKPSQPGYYWIWGGNEAVDPEVVMVRNISDDILAVMFDDGGIASLEDYKFWIGPMGMPEKRINSSDG